MTQSATDISVLVKGCIQQQESAQRALVQQYSPLLLSVARRYARNQAEAKDILQDAFILIFSKIHTFDDTRSSLPGWLRKVVINTALGHYRKFYFDHEQGMDVLPDIDIAPDIFSKLGFNELIELISTLPEGARQVFNLSVFDDYSHDEISEKLGIPSGTSRSLLSRARKILQEKILKLHEHELASI